MAIQVPQVRILVIDDDKAICEYVTTILDKDGMSVTSLTARSRKAFRTRCSKRTAGRRWKR